MNNKWIIKNHTLGKLLISRIPKGDKQYKKVERRYINKWVSNNNREFFKNIERTTSSRSIITKSRWRLIRKLSRKEGL